MPKVLIDYLASLKKSIITLRFTHVVSVVPVSLRVMAFLGAWEILLPAYGHQGGSNKLLYKFFKVTVFSYVEE